MSWVLRQGKDHPVARPPSKPGLLHSLSELELKLEEVPRAVQMHSQPTPPESNPRTALIPSELAP